MVKIGFKHTEETKRKISISKKGKSVKHLGQFKKGISPWNKGIVMNESFKKNMIGNTNGFKKGYIPYNKGKKGIYKHSEDIKRQISLSSKGKPKSKEAIEKRLKTIKERYGKLKAWNKDKLWSIESKNKMSKSHKGLLIGEKHPMWKGGISNEPYDIKFNKEFKNLVKLRDNFCCQECGISEQKYKLINNTSLITHHIDYNKKNTCLKNCICLCNSCHFKTNNNRKYWQEHFENLLMLNYNYDYGRINTLFVFDKI